MRFLIFISLVLVPVCAQAQLISGPTTNIQSGPLSLTNVNGTGLDMQLSITGDFTSGTANITNAGFGVSQPDRFGWDYNIDSGVFHSMDTVMRLEATNGTFDGRLGWEKQSGHPDDNLFFRSDGTWNTNGQSFLSVVGDTVAVDPGTSIAFVSSETGSIFTPQLSGATFVELSRTNTLAFSNGNQEFDFDLTAAEVAAVPEPASLAVFPLLGLGLLYWRRRKKCLTNQQTSI